MSPKTDRNRLEKNRVFVRNHVMVNFEDTFHSSVRFTSVSWNFQLDNSRLLFAHTQLFLVNFSDMKICLLKVRHVNQNKADGNVVVTFMMIVFLLAS